MISTSQVKSLFFAVCPCPCRQLLSDCCLRLFNTHTLLQQKGMFGVTLVIVGLQVGAVTADCVSNSVFSR